MNSINWPALNMWVFIAQLVEHCSANAEAMGSNPFGALKFFSGLNLHLIARNVRRADEVFKCGSGVKDLLDFFNDL